MAETALATVDWSAVGPLLLTSLAIMGSPGPTTISLVAIGSAFGVRRSMPYLAGVIAGTTVVLVAIATGVTAMLLAVPALGSGGDLGGVHPVAGVSHRDCAAARPPDGRPAAPSPAGGALLGVANPKAWVAIAAVFASVEVAGSATADAAAKLAILTAIIVLIHIAWLVAGVSIAPLLRDRRRARVINGAMALALLAATALGALPH
jgi:threonine/homoserine/homoserine lactone efflux protein